MKIVHISLNGPYTDNWGYQDNILPRMQKKMGHDVTVIAPCFKHDDGGKIITVEPGRYTLDDGVQVIRISFKKTLIIEKLKKLIMPYDIYPILMELSPDLIMVHGMSVASGNKDIIKYIHKKSGKCTVVGDTHLYDLIAHSSPRRIKEKLIQKYKYSKMKDLYPYYKQIFAITPSCIDFAVAEYGIPREKIKLLPLGYDPYQYNWDDREKTKKKFRDKYNINSDDIVIIHGGKIEARRKTPETIEAVKQLNNPKVKLVIFGGIADNMKSIIAPLIKENKKIVTYLGQLTPAEYYNAYLASDIALFPGGQSTLWQEAIGCGLPLVVGNAKGLDYLDMGGNIEFINDVTANGINQILRKVIESDKIKSMKDCAETKGREYFSYERIARVVLDCVE